MSYEIVVYALDGTQKEAVALSEMFVDTAINQSLIHEYVVMYLAHQRQNTAKTKTRAEVSLSGRKLFRQKGTGRARVGDAASPIRKKGGVAFGPSPLTNWNKKMNQKMKQKALLGSLIMQLKDEKIKAVTELSFSLAKTKEALKILVGLQLTTKTLIVLEQHNEVVYKSFRNIPGISVTTLAELNPYQVLTHKTILFTKQAATQLSSRFHLLTQSV